MPWRNKAPRRSRWAKLSLVSARIAASPARIVTGLAVKVPPCGRAGLPAGGSNTAMASARPAAAPTGNPAADDLAERRQVGRNAPQALRAGPSKPKRDDFVEDDER